jgi:hypothetical protein
MQREQRLSFAGTKRRFPFLCFLWFEEVPTSPRNLVILSVLYISERPEMISHDEEPNKAKTTKGKIESTKGEKMNLKKQIAVIVLALTATTSPVWSQDRQPLPSPTAHTLHGTWRVTRTAVDCITGQDILSFPAIMTFNQGGTYTGYGVPPGGDPGQGTEYGVWQREPGSHNYSNRAVFYSYTAEGDFDGRGEATEAIQLTTADSFTGTGTVQIFDADGNLIVTICATSTGTRFE